MLLLANILIIFRLLCLPSFIPSAQHVDRSRSSILSSSNANAPQRSARWSQFKRIRICFCCCCCSERVLLVTSWDKDAKVKVVVNWSATHHSGKSVCCAISGCVFIILALIVEANWSEKSAIYSFPAKSFFLIACKLLQWWPPICIIHIHWLTPKGYYISGAQIIMISIIDDQLKVRDSRRDFSWGGWNRDWSLSVVFGVNIWMVESAA